MENDISQFLYDKHTEFLIEEKERRMDNIRKLCAGKKIVFHPVDMAIFLNVIKKVAKKYNIQHLIPNQPFDSIFAFLEEVLSRFKNAGVSEHDLQWIINTFNTINGGKDEQKIKTT